MDFFCDRRMVFDIELMWFILWSFVGVVCLWNDMFVVIKVFKMWMVIILVIVKFK